MNAVVERNAVTEPVAAFLDYLDATEELSKENKQYLADEITRYSTNFMAGSVSDKLLAAIIAYILCE